MGHGSMGKASKNIFGLNPEAYGLYIFFLFACPCCSH